MSCMQSEAKPGDRPQGATLVPQAPRLVRPRGSTPIAMVRGPLCRCGCWLPEVDDPAGGAWVRAVSQNPELCSIRAGSGATSSLSRGMRPQGKQDTVPSRVTSEPLQAAAPQTMAASSQDSATPDGQRTDLSGPNDETLLMAGRTHSKLRP